MPIKIIQVIISEKSKMGLSALQARLLMIVARMNDIANEQASISQSQADLAKQSEAVAKEYSDAMSNTKLIIHVTNTSGDTFVTERKDLDYQTMSEQGYLPVTKNDEILLKKDENGEWIIPKDIDGNDLIRIENGKAIILNEEKSKTEPKQYKLRDGSSYLNDAQSINDALSYGALYLLNVNDLDTGKITINNLPVGSRIKSVMDTTDDAAAQSKYQYETARLKRIENQYDVEMKKLDTEVTALNKEYDSITKAIEKNVDRTFGLFENG